MIGSDADEEVFLVPLDAGFVLVLPVTAELATTGGLDVPTLVQAVGPLVGAVLKQGGLGTAKLYELSPESQRQLANARRDEVGDYFRAVLRNGRGRVSHQVQMREVHAAPAPSGFDAVAAAQLAAIQAQLSRIEETMHQMALSIDNVLGFVERQQRARIAASLRILREIHDRAQRTGVVTDTDWSRLSGVELAIETQLHAVDDELATLLNGRTFGITPKSDAAQMSAINPQRVQELVRAHRLLVGGLRGWYELLLLRKYTVDQLTKAEVAVVGERLEALEKRRRDLIDLIDAVIEASSDPATRGWLTRLLTEGLVNGSRKDAERRTTLTTGRKRLAEVTAEAKSSLPTPAKRTVLTASHEPHTAVLPPRE